MMRWGLPEEGETVLGRRVRLCYDKVVWCGQVAVAGWHCALRDRREHMQQMHSDSAVQPPGRGYDSGA